MKYIRPLFILVLLLTPSLTQANLKITEIMYDPEGPDTNREWIEVYNAGDDVTVMGGLGKTWRLHEESISGKLNRRTFSFEGEEGTITIPSKSYAVIARNSTGFREDFPMYDGTLFFSTMSLTNTEGRRLSIHDAVGNQMSDSVLYVPVPEAGGTGASLQLQEDGSWIAGLPTPGLENTTRKFSLEIEEESEKDIDDDFLSLESDWPFLEEKLFINAGENRRVFVGEDIEFRVQVRFKNGQKLQARNATWAFGNGDGDGGESVKYRYPRSGVYRVVVRIPHNGQLYQDALLVHVLDTKEIELFKSDGKSVEIKNNSDYEVEISLWSLRSGRDSKVFAPGTHILPNSVIAIPFSHSSQDISLYDSRENQVTTASRESEVLEAEHAYEKIRSRLREMLEKAQRSRIRSGE